MNYKIEILNKMQGIQVQRCLFKLGYEWVESKKNFVKVDEREYIFALGLNGGGGELIIADEQQYAYCKKVTLEELEEMPGIIAEVEDYSDFGGAGVVDRGKFATVEIPAIVKNTKNNLQEQIKKIQEEIKELELSTEKHEYVEMVEISGNIIQYTTEYLLQVQEKLKALGLETDLFKLMQELNTRK